MEITGTIARVTVTQRFHNPAQFWLKVGTRLLLQTADGAELTYEIADAVILDTRSERLALSPESATSDLTHLLTVRCCHPGRLVALR